MTTATQLSATKAAPTSLMQLLQRQRSAIEAALPRHMTADRLLRVVLTEVRKNPTLSKCEPLSFLGAVVQAAQLGLEPGGALGHCYLVPYFNKSAGKYEVQLIVGYRGMLDLARRSGQLVSVSTHAVYDGDEFDFALGLNETLRHVPARDGVSKERRLVAVYAVAKLRDGGVQLEVMSRDEVEAIRRRSKAADSGPWKTDYEEMAKKTCVRRLFKYLPVSIEIQRAVGLDEKAAVGESQQNDLLVLDTLEDAADGLGGQRDQLADLNHKFGSLPQQPN